MRLDDFAGSAASFINLFSFVTRTIAIILTTKLIHALEYFGLFIAIMGDLEIWNSIHSKSKTLKFQTTQQLQKGNYENYKIIRKKW